MASNPFFIQPVDLSSGLQGLGNMLAAKQKMDLAKEEAAKKEQRFSDYLAQAKQAKTPEDFAQLGLMFPEHANATKLSIDVIANQSGIDKDLMTSLYKKASISPSPVDVFVDWIAANPDHAMVDQIVTDIGWALNDPEKFKDYVQKMWASADPEGYKAAMGGADKPLGRKDQAELYKDFTRESVQKAIAADDMSQLVPIDKTTGKDRYMVVGKSLFDTSNGTWVGGGPQPDEEMKPSDITSINKAVTDLTKDASNIISSARRLKALEESNSPTDQLAAIFEFMRALDPNSVVREGEQQMAVRTGGPADALVSMVNNLAGEGKLTPTAFANMVRTAETLAADAADSAKTKVKGFLEPYGDMINPERRRSYEERIPVFESPETTTDASGGNLTVGQIYRDASGARARYLGGGKWEEFK